MALPNPESPQDAKLWPNGFPVRGDDALRSTVGAAAKFTVKDNRGKPVFADWQPYAGQQTHPEKSLRPQIEEASAQAAEKNSCRPERQAASWTQDHASN